jgi:hypothetical protein
MKIAAFLFAVSMCPIAFSVGCGNSGAGSVAADMAPVPDMSVVHAEPPVPGPTMPGDGTGSVTVAISKLFLGDTDWDGTVDKVNGWKNFGYDLDDKVSTATSTDLCKPANGASPRNVYPDGNNGIDNSFGKLILPIILGIASDTPRKINASIAGGSFTVMLEMEKLGASADYNPINTNFWTGGKLGFAPKFDGTDVWPVLATLVNDGTNLSSGSKVDFPTSYLANNVWVSGSRGNVELDLTASGFTLPLTITNAVITIKLDSAHRSGIQGIIAGVLNTQQFATQFRMWVAAFDPTLCSGPTIDSIVSQITQASDIMADGTQDPSRTCDGISIGIGFNAEPVQLGAVVPPPSPTPNPCGH